MIEILLAVIFSLLLLPGVAMSLVPMLPALPYMFIVAAFYGLVTQFAFFTIRELEILAALVIVSLIIDWSAGLIGAKYGGASAKSLLYGLAGILIGSFAAPPLGSLLGLFLGVLVGELVARRSHFRAVRAAAGSLAGAIVGVVTNVLLSVAFFILFLVFLL